MTKMANWKEKKKSFLEFSSGYTQSPVRKCFNRYRQKNPYAFYSDLNSNVKPYPITVMGLMTIYICNGTFELGGNYLLGINFRHAHKS